MIPNDTTKKKLEPSELSQKLTRERDEHTQQRLARAKEYLRGMPTITEEEKKQKRPGASQDQAPQHTWRGGRYRKDIEEALTQILEQARGEQKKSARYPETPAELETQVQIFGDVGDALLATTENKKFTIDPGNEQIIRLLIAYLNKWEETFTTIAQRVTGTKGDIYAPLMIMGAKGVGKTLLMQVAAKFTEVMKLHRAEFLNTSASELLNCMRVNGNIDYFTYNTGRQQVKAGNPYTARPWNVCMHDLGVELDAKQNIYGTSMSAVVSDFLMARYELFQNNGLHCHITTNLSISDLWAKYPPRVVDRFKQYNFIIMEGESRR